jgi:hypothetical protein
VHEDEHVQLLSLSPERIEIFTVIVLMIHIGRDVSAAEPQLYDRVFQNLRCARRFLYWYSGHRSKPLRIFFQKFFNALVVDTAPTLSLFALEIVAEQLRARIKRRQRDFAFRHHL